MDEARRQTSSVGADRQLRRGIQLFMPPSPDIGRVTNVFLSRLARDECAAPLTGLATSCVIGAGSGPWPLIPRHSPFCDQDNVKCLTGVGAQFCGGLP